MSDDIERLTKALMLAFQGGYDLNENASPAVRAYYAHYRSKATAVKAVLAAQGAAGAHENTSARNGAPSDSAAS